MTKVLLTGGSGFIAAHILEQLVERGHDVVTTVRSEDKAQPIRDAYKGRGKVEVVIVPDIAQEDAFDEVVKTPGLEAVLHTASPFHYQSSDGKTGLVDPAVIGTTGILRAIKRSAPSVRRVVVTSSFAAILDGDKLDDPATTFTEASWNPAGLDRVSESLIVAYRVSKVLAERAAWDEAKEAAFDLVTVNPPLVFGPVAHHLAGGVSAINTSNQRVVDLLQGKWREQLPPTGLVSIWVDVRDVATAHVGALERPEAAGRRLFTVAGHFSNRQIADAARAYADANGFLAEYQDKLPAPDAPGGERPAEGEAFKWNADETNKLLGIKYITIEQSIGDLFKSLKEHGI